MTGRAGYIDGKHFTTYCDKAFQLKKEKKYDSAIDLLLKIIDATEAESKADGCGVAPGYYEQLAIIYRKLKLIAEEKKILVRYSKQKHAPGCKPLVLYERLGILNAKYPNL